MPTYCHISNGAVDNRAIFDSAPPDDWPDRANWVASEEAQIGWSYSAGVFAAPPVPPAPPVDLTAYAANKRFSVETGGITVAGAHIQTDRDSQAMITGAYAYAQANPTATINYKAEGGFVSLTAAQMTAIGLAVGAHVQACFAAEAAIDADIAAGAITTTVQIDGDARWPAIAAV
jgi:hypothetical protein